MKIKGDKMQNNSATSTAQCNKKKKNQMFERYASANNVAYKNKFA